MTDVISRVVEAVVFQRTQGDARILILKRAPEEALHPGIWQIVTGTLEEDETSVEAAVREVREETGLTPLNMWTVPFVNSFFDRKRNAVQMIPWFAFEVEAGARARLSAEHTDHQWTSFDHAASLMAWPGQRQGLRVVLEEIVKGGPAAALLVIPR